LKTAQYRFLRARTWTWVVDDGIDPATGKRNQRSKGGYARERDALKGMREYLADRGSHAPTRTKDTLAAYVEGQWLPASGEAIDPGQLCRRCGARVIPRIGAVKLVEFATKHIADRYADLLENGRREQKLVENESKRTVERGLSERALRYTARWSRSATT